MLQRQLYLYKLDVLVEENERLDDRLDAAT